MLLLLSVVVVCSCPCFVVVVVAVVFGELIVSFFASPANVVAVTALRLPLTDEVDVVADGFAARDVLPLANVVPTVPHNNTVLKDLEWKRRI